MQCDCETRNCEVAGRHTAGGCKYAPDVKVRFDRYGIVQNLCNECLTTCWQPSDYTYIKLGQCSRCANAECICGDPAFEAWIEQELAAQRRTA